MVSDGQGQCVCLLQTDKEGPVCLSLADRQGGASVSVSCRQTGRGQCVCLLQTDREGPVCLSIEGATSEGEQGNLTAMKCLSRKCC